MGLLRDFGNLSSATILFVLDQWQGERRPPGGRAGSPLGSGPAWRGAPPLAMGMRAYLLLLGAIGLVRLAELGHSRRNQRAMASQGVAMARDPAFIGWSHSTSG